MAKMCTFKIHQADADQADEAVSVNPLLVRVVRRATADATLIQFDHTHSIVVYGQPEAICQALDDA